MATRTASSKKVNLWYMRHAASEMVIDMLNDKLICIVPSENDLEKSYTVHVDEITVLVPVATSCECRAFEMHKTCKHCTIVNSYYKHIYRSSIAKAQAKAAAQHVVESVSPEAVEEEEEQFLPETKYFAHLDKQPLEHRTCILRYGYFFYPCYRDESDKWHYYHDEKGKAIVLLNDMDANAFLAKQLPSRQKIAG